MLPVTGNSVGKGNRRRSTSWGLLTSVGNGTRPRRSPSGELLRKSEWLRSSRSSRLSFNAVSMIAPVRSVYGFGVWSPVTTNTMLSPATSINCVSSASASIDYGTTYWFAAVNARGRAGRSSLRSSTGGYQHPVCCTLIPIPAFTPTILHKSRMRKRARTDLSGGRPVMSVPTGSIIVWRLTAAILTGSLSLNWEPARNSARGTRLLADSMSASDR